jgi:hypothetical protein
LLINAVKLMAALYLAWVSINAKDRKTKEFVGIDLIKWKDKIWVNQNLKR